MSKPNNVLAEENSKKNAISLNNFFNSILECCNCFPPEFNEHHLLPKIYSAIRAKTANL